MISSLKKKLHPDRFDGMSPLMAAIVGYVLGESFSTPEIAEIKVSETEDLVHIREVGAATFGEIQSLRDLRSNWNRLMDAADLTPEERREAVRLFKARVEKMPGLET